MKKFFLAATAVALCMTSCSTIRKSSTSLVVDSSINAATQAELIVSPNKVSYTTIPSKKVRRGGNHNVRETAIAELLQQNGDADVLVEPRFETVEKRGKIKKITVTGYPATYKNFSKVK